LKSGYLPSEIAYIKPATQCEEPQLISKFCKAKGIAYNGIGPLVFYSGFTRAFLNGETDSTEKILESIEMAVDEIAKGKRFVVIDGVGYPAVGSICGCSNATIAHRCRAPVVLVGKKGVGDAVDSFNLNAAFFRLHQVPVVGVLYNRLENEGYYSLEKCKDAVSKYFKIYGKAYKLFGFLPELKLGSKSGNASQSDADSVEVANVFIDSFENNIDFTSFLESIKMFHNHTTNNVEKEVEARAELKLQDDLFANYLSDSPQTKKRSRDSIQQEARGSGASGG
jgi:dethiobiotin synthetase